MHYLISVIDNITGGATDSEMAHIDQFNDWLRAEGHWVFAGGLATPARATVIDNRSGNPLFSDGPFIESKDYMAGFWIIDAPSPEVALQVAAEGSNSCGRRVEVRPFLAG